MATSSEFHPEWASPPGDTIADILQERKLSVQEFGRQLNYGTQEVDELLTGRAAITLATARRLEVLLGPSVEFWMTRDLQYREDIARSKNSDADWLAELPVADMIHFGWIAAVTNLQEKVTACMRFFGVASVSEWNLRYAGVQQTVAFKMSHATDSRLAAVAAWLRRGEIEAQATKCEPWDPKRLEASLDYFRSLTQLKDPKKFLPQLTARCAECGVALVLVPTPRGCPASGATLFLAPYKAMLLLSFRYGGDDNFWFAFFHEIGHLLLHGAKGLFIEDSNVPPNFQEQEANEFAMDVLIPARFRSELFALKANTRDVLRFALKVGIAPGIVVGQLHYHHIIPYNFLNGLVRHYRWVDGES